MFKAKSGKDFLDVQENSSHASIENGKEKSLGIVEDVMSQVLNDALESSDFDNDNVLGDKKCTSYDEEEIVMGIKDLRRMCESRNSESDLASTVSNNWIESGEDKVDDDDGGRDVDLKRSCCEFQKRKRSVSPCCFGNINISPVKKIARSNSPVSSTKSASKSGSSSLHSSIPWSSSEAPPTIVWSDVKSRPAEGEPEESSYSCIGSDDNPEEEVQMSFDDRKVSDAYDLREILNKKRKGQNRNQSPSFVQQGNNNNNEIKVIVRDTGRIKVVETQEDLRMTIYEASQCEEGKIFDHEVTDYYDQDDDYKELNPMYRGYCMSDLIMKKKVLEHLIEMANKEECEGSAKNVNLEPERRKVVYREPSPYSDSENRKNILKDFTAEFEKRINEFFPSKEDKHDIPIKMEPVDDEVEVKAVSEGVTKHAKKEVRKPKSPLTYKYKPKVQVEDRRCNSPSSYKYECSICKITVGTKFSMEQHRRGRRHKLNIEREKTETGSVSTSGYQNFKRREREVGKHWYSPCKRPREPVSESAYSRRGVGGSLAKRKDSSERSARGKGVVKSKSSEVITQKAKNSKEDVTRSSKDKSWGDKIKNEAGKCYVDKNVGTKDGTSLGKPIRKRIVWDLN